MKTYQDFKNEWLGKRVDADGVFGYQCVDLPLQFIKEVSGSNASIYGNAIDYATKPTPAFLAKVVRVTDGSKVSGDILVFSSPATPDGHITLRDTNLDQMLEQNGATGSGTGTGRDAIGVYRNIPYDRLVAVYRLKEFVNIPAAAPAPAQAGVQAPSGKKLFLPSAAGTWRVYPLGGPWTPGHEVGKLAPGQFPPGLTYDVLGQIAPNIVKIHTTTFGDVAIYVGSDTIAQWVDAAPAAPAPAPAAPAAPQLPERPANTVYTKLAAPLDLVTNKQPTHWWALNFKDDAHAVSLNDLPQGTGFRAFGKAQRTDGDKPVYFMTEEDFGQADVTGIPTNNNGVNTVDLSPAPAPAAPTPPAAPETPAPAEQAAPAASEEVKVPVTVKKWQDTFDSTVAGEYKATTDATIHDLAGKHADVQLGHDQDVPVAGKVTKEGEEYYITVKSHEAGNWYGVPKNILVRRTTPVKQSALLDDIKHPVAAAHQVVDEIDKIDAELSQDPEFVKYKSTLTPRGKAVATLAEAEQKVDGILSKVNIFKKKNQ